MSVGSGNQSRKHSQTSGEDIDATVIDKSLSELIQKLEEIDDQAKQGHINGVAGIQQAKLQILRGNVVRLAKTQSGSKFLQRMVNNVNQDLVEFFLNEIGAELPLMMVDNYGNYFCSQLLAICSSD